LIGINSSKEILRGFIVDAKINQVSLQKNLGQAKKNLAKGEGKNQQNQKIDFLHCLK